MRIAFGAKVACHVEATDDPIYRTDRWFYCGEDFVCLRDYSTYSRWIGCQAGAEYVSGDGTWVCLKIEGHNLMRR